MAKRIDSNDLSRRGLLSRVGVPLRGSGPIINPNPINNPSCLGTNCTVPNNFVSDFKTVLKEAIESFPPSSSYSQTIGITTPDIPSSMQGVSPKFLFGANNIISYNNVPTPYQFQIITNSGVPAVLDVPFYQCIRIQDVGTGVCPVLNFCFKGVRKELIGSPGIYYYDVLDIKVCMCDPVTHDALEYDTCIQCINSNSRCLASGIGARRVGGGLDKWRGNFLPSPFPATIANPVQWDAPSSCPLPTFTISDIGGQSAVVHSHDPITGTFVIEVTGGTPPDGLYEAIITADFGPCGILHLIVEVNKNYTAGICTQPSFINLNSFTYGPTSNLYPGVRSVFGGGIGYLGSYIDMPMITSMGVNVGLNVYTIETAIVIIPPDSCCFGVTPNPVIVGTTPPFVNSITFSGYNVGDTVTIDVNASISTVNAGHIFSFAVDLFYGLSTCQTFYLPFSLYRADNILSFFVCPPAVWTDYLVGYDNIANVFPPDKKQNIGGFDHAILSVANNSYDPLKTIIPYGSAPSIYVNRGSIITQPYFTAGMPLCAEKFGKITSSVAWLKVIAASASLTQGSGISFILYPGHPPIGSSGTVMLDFYSPNMGTISIPLRYTIVA